MKEPKSAAFCFCPRRGEKHSCIVFWIRDRKGSVRAFKFESRDRERAECLGRRDERHRRRRGVSAAYRACPCACEKNEQSNKSRRDGKTLNRVHELLDEMSESVGPVDLHVVDDAEGHAARGEGDRGGACGCVCAACDEKRNRQKGAQYGMRARPPVVGGERRVANRGSEAESA